MSQAFTLLREHARSTSQRLTDVARHVIDSPTADFPLASPRGKSRQVGPAGASGRHAQKRLNCPGAADRSVIFGRRDCGSSAASLSSLQRASSA